MSACIICSPAREINWRKRRRRFLAGPFAFFSLFFTAITQFTRTPLVTSPPPPGNTPPSIHVSTVSVVETAPSIPVSVETAPTSMPDVSVETAPQHILVSVETGHWYGDYERIVPCVEGMRCEFAKNRREDADVLWHHLCSSPSQRAQPDQLALIMSFESSVNYPCLEDPDHLKRFNITMTYRLDSSLPLPSLREDHLQAFTEPVVPFEQKKDAIVFLQHNCASRSGREDFVRSLIAANFTVDSVGKCLNNAPMLATGQSSMKRDTLAQYKFCLTFENSVTPFYTSEKLWDGMSAGCLTIYKGAPNVRDYLPDAERSTLIVDDSTDFAAFANRLQSLMRDKDEYESYFVWRTRELREQQLGYRDLVGIVNWPYHSQCMICLMAAEAKITGRVPHWKDVLKLSPEDSKARR